MFTQGDKVKVRGSSTGRVWEVVQYEGGGLYRLVFGDKEMIDHADNLIKVRGK